MPQALIAAITPYVASFLYGVTASTAFVVAATAAVSAALVYGALAVASYLVSAAFAPAKPEAPKPEDGKFNLKQPVPPLAYVLGRVKKGGDYAFLEERAGVASHVMVHAAHRIKGFVEHYLHDEAVTLSGSTVVTPAHFDGRVFIETRLGEPASTAYGDLVARYPEIWTTDHRGDGLATVQMNVQSVAAENLQKTFPSGMPQHQAIIDGHAEIHDPRTGTHGYTTNLALHRLWHLTSPVGGKLSMTDMYLPDWSVAADVCDQWVTNRAGAQVRRYHGGFWFRANNDPVQVGRIMDQAAELVVYERPDGKVGVHAGRFVEPDVRLTAVDIVSLSYDPNKRRGTNVLAVRGRYTDPAKGFNTADAAIYGEPYPSDDERTKTVENQAVQDHNHMGRLQKLAYVRANAPRVKLVAHYDSAKLVPYRRFITVHYPPKMTEAVIEIIGRPTLSLRSLSYDIEGIVVPANLYSFDSSSEEGEPGTNVVPIERGDVPVPENFVVTIETEEVGGGSSAAYAEASFDFQNDAFQYELEWQPTAGGTVQTVLGSPGELTVRSTFLGDGVEYSFGARTWSVGTPSDRTAPQTLTATADPVAPGVVTGVSGVGGAGQITFNWTAPNSSNYSGARLYWNTSNTIVGATLAATEFGAPNAADTRVVTGISAGTRFGFIVAINGSGVAAAAIPTGPVTVT
jgi:hypothetical protein